MFARSIIWRRRLTVYTWLDDGLGGGLSTLSGSGEQPGKAPNSANAPDLIASWDTLFAEQKIKRSARHSEPWFGVSSRMSKDGFISGLKNRVLQNIART